MEFPGVTEIKATLCYCPENMNTHITPPTLERHTVNTTAFTAIMTQARQKAGSGSDI